METKHSKWHTVALVVAALTLVVLIAGSGFVAWYLLDDHVGPDIPFDAQTWKTAVHYPDETRLRMTNDLLHRHPLLGMTEEEVTALLGDPSDPSYASRNCIVYWLGPEPGHIRIDSAWLEIEFVSGRVVDVLIKTD